MIQLRAGDPIYLGHQLVGGATTKHVRAHLFDGTNAELVGSPIVLAHVAGGLYTNNGGLSMPASPVVRAQIQTFDDSGFTTPTTGEAPALQTFALAPVAPGGVIVGIVQEAS